MSENLKELMNTVVANDYCIGCGICASLNESPLKMEIDENGKYTPVVDESVMSRNINDDFLSVCPFADKSKNETEIGNEVFGQFKDTKFNKYTGFYLKNYAGYVKEREFRKKGSSGGMGNWIASELLRQNLVDGIIHVKSATGSDNLLFDYQISYSEKELFEGAKSKYYPIEMSQVIQLVKEKEGKYALVGIPCYIKSIRLLAEQDEIVKDRIKYFIGLVCGHLKSDMFAKSIGWQLGILPADLNNIDFRKKLKDQPANRYGVEVEGEKNGKNVVVSAPTKDLYTTNWGHGFFKYNACEFCDDVLAETADVTIGDAWLPEYSGDSMGTNIITVRNPDIQKLFEDRADEIYVEEISSDKVYQSQAGGFRHRRDGLAYRLFLKDSNNEWRPQKRVQASNKISSKRKRIYEQRTLLSKESFNAYKIAEKQENFNAFKDYMDPLIKEYQKSATSSVGSRIIGKMKREIKRLITK